MLHTKMISEKKEEGDSFDKSIGFTRTKLLDFILSQEKDSPVIKLLTPEIRITVARELYLSHKSDAIAEFQLEHEENLLRLIELQEINEALTEEEEKGPILEAIKELTERNQFLEQKITEIATYSSILPESVRNKHFTHLAKEFWDVLTKPDFKQMISKCSSVLGYTRFLSLEELDILFSTDKTRSQYAELYLMYQSIRTQYYQPIEARIQLFCEDPQTFKNCNCSHPSNENFFLKKLDTYF